MDRRAFFRLTALGSLGAALAPSAFAAETAPVAARTQLGIDVLAAGGFETLRGVRCGLVTHRAGMNGAGQRTVDVLAAAPGVRLTKLFGPEHGIDGNAAAEISVKNAKDARTGLPVYSLYGATRKPTPEMLEGLDAIVIDFQDVGARSYTYISCMRYVI